MKKVLVQVIAVTSSYMSAPFVHRKVLWPSGEPAKRKKNKLVVIVGREIKM